jgi:hypothetical protein
MSCTPLIEVTRQRKRGIGGPHILDVVCIGFFEASTAADSNGKIIVRVSGAQERSTGGAGTALGRIDSRTTP